MVVMTVEDCVGGRSPGRVLRRINKLMMAQVEARYADADFGFTPWLALKLLHDGIVTNAGELARELDMTTGATTRLIDGLEALSLLVRDRGSADRRVVRLKLTEAGTVRYLDRISILVSAWNEILVDFDRDEVDQMVQLLTRLMRSFERHALPQPTLPPGQAE
ncbi:MAG: MarR family winged helix-turn-helix transcriptional regulator [Janthinobacterium lividum]